MIKLSKRLQIIADQVKQGAKIADIGSDHGLLPVYLLQSGRAVSAVAGELNEGPYRAACKQVADAGLTDKIAVRQGDGLSVLTPGEADTVTIAGMGGSLMASILEQGNADGKLLGVKELILQPNVGEAEVRKWLVSHHWVLTSEHIIEEDGHFYEILHAQQGADAQAADESNRRLYNPASFILQRDPAEQSKWLYWMGPHLLKASPAAFIGKWEQEIRKLERIYKQVSQSNLAEAKQKAADFQAEIETIKEVLACLQTAKS
ncbi:tRNA (adenine(22)-N(1))-methyltransferase [Paenibacillus sp. GCM10027626]|uniref:tRNA (adenine(22)-N(1))-methyltransferase n=1 Tax=Paenibacillus sp. GCM10027626 TaxID=3273411 RepID=UPI0036342DE4